MDSSSGFFITPSDVKDAGLSTFELVHSSKNGFSLVYKANLGGKMRAFKALKPEFRGNPVYEDLLKKEYEIGCGLDHPGIRQYNRYTQIVGLGNCLEMEWVDGETLDKFRLQSSSARKEILLQVCDALSYIHSKQIVFRDLKPANILVTHNGRNVKLIDFGFADADCYTLLKTPAGTPAYASPEQIEGGRIDNRSDIYSLGVIIREFLPSKRRVAAKCTRRNREKRFRNAAEVKRAMMARPIWWLAIPMIVAVCVWWGWGRRAQAAAPAETEAAVPAEDSLSLEELFREATQMIMDSDEGQVN